MIDESGIALPTARLFNLTVPTQLILITADQLPFIHSSSAVEAVGDVHQPAFGFVRSTPVTCATFVVGKVLPAGVGQRNAQRTAGLHHVPAHEIS